MDKVIWCNRGYFPGYFGFCPNEKAWNNEMRRLEIKERAQYPNSDGRCSFFTSPEGKSLTIVTIGEQVDKLDSIAIACLIVHEAMHVMQNLMEHMGEKNPSSEFEAYSIQTITLELMVAYSKTRRAK